jgi:hypothetical protein
VVATAMTARALASIEQHIAAALAGFVLFVVNVAIYATWPRLIATFHGRVGRYPNVADPETINEKVTWRKVFDRNPLFPVLQDKLRGRDYVAARCPELALPEILWRGHDPFAIPFDLIREPVVIKTNHGCGYNYFIRDPENVDKVAISVFFASALSRRWGSDAWEWAYSRIEPTVYVEKLLTREDGSVPDDYKVNLFGGKTHVCSLTLGPPGQRVLAYYDTDNRRVEAKLNDYGVGSAPPPGPMHDRARALAESLCPDLDAIRVDCYIHEGRIWFGEFTVYPGSGFQNYQPESFGIFRGRPWNILQSHYFTQPGRFRRIYRWCLETRGRIGAEAAVERESAAAPETQRIGGA